MDNHDHHRIPSQNLPDIPDPEDLEASEAREVGEASLKDYETPRSTNGVPGGPSPGGDLYTIGEVVSTLREDFPELSVSKVRYLERRRLIELERTSGGYRLFNTDDIELLRAILTLQENEYLPLEVIKERIDSGIIQRHSDKQEMWGSEGEWGSENQEGGKTYTKNELCEELEVDARFVGELISVGVIGRDVENAGNGEMSGRDVEIARMAIEMSGYGIQPRHLRGIVAAVDRETAMFKQVLNPELRSGDDKRVSGALENARHLASVDSRMKELIMACAIDAMGSPGRP